MKACSILFTTLITLAAAQKDSGSLDGQNSEDSSQKESSNSQEITPTTTKEAQESASTVVSTGKEWRGLRSTVESSNNHLPRILSFLEERQPLKT